MWKKKSNFRTFQKMLEILRKKIFEKVRKYDLLFCRNIVEYACKSNEAVLQKIYVKKLIIFPLII